MPRTFHAPTRRALLLGSGAAVRLGRSAAARARRRPRPAASGDRAARRARRARGRRAGRRSRLAQFARRQGADCSTAHTPGLAARRLLRAEPGDAEPAPALSSGAGADRARGRDPLSRALAFRRAGCARKRPARARAPPIPAGSTARSRRLAPGEPVPVRMAGRPLRSGRSRRSSCAARRRCCRGCRRGCRRSATTR